MKAVMRKEEQFVNALLQLEDPKAAINERGPLAELRRKAHAQLELCREQIPLLSKQMKEKKPNQGLEAFHILSKINNLERGLYDHILALLDSQSVPLK